MVSLSLDGLLIRARDPAATLARLLGEGATLVAPVEDHGWFVGGRVAIEGVGLSISRHGPDAPDTIDALVLATPGGPWGLRAAARALDLAATVPVHSAIAIGPSRDPVAWWTLALPGLLDDGPALPTWGGGLATALTQTLLGTDRMRRLAAARARGPMVVLVAPETMPSPLSKTTGRIAIETGAHAAAWSRIVESLGDDGARLDPRPGRRARVLGLSRADGTPVALV